MRFSFRKSGGGRQVVRRRLTVRYIVGLAIIGALAVTSTMLVNRELSQQENDAYRIGVTARQSVLAHQLDTAAADAVYATDETARTKAAGRITAILGQLESTHDGLIFGDPGQGVEPVTEPDAQRLFLGVIPPFAQIQVIANRIAADPSVDETTLEALETQTRLFRDGMDVITFQLEQESAAGIRGMRKAQIALLDITLVLLVLEAVFLFRPVAVGIQRHMEEREELHAAEREADQEEINYMAQFDSLTGLANRTLLQDRLQHAVHRARRDGGLISLMFIDLDDFKAVNDRHGHAVGDELLRQVANRLRSSVRESDTIARLGGDEFMVVLEGGHRVEHASAVAEKIIAEISQPIIIEDGEHHVTASIGIAVYPLDGDEVDELLKDADIAMYSAKEAGRNTYQYFTSELRAKTAERLFLVDSLRKALARDDQLRLVYQPKIDMRTGAILGLEALLRWNHPELGSIPPGRFIPLAEESDLIVALGDWVIQETCRQAREWRRQGLAELRISVNVSSRQFRQGDLVETVVGAIEAAGLDPGMLELELTEGTLVEDTERARRVLERLRDSGIKVSVDDFGTGYSSLSYLKRFPIDALKIDRSFISDITDDADDAAISEAIINMGRSLNLEVIAEGVETTRQRDFLLSLGCDLAQGFLYSRPLDADKVAPFVTTLHGAPLN